MEEEFDLIENLHLLSNDAIDNPLKKLKSHTIIFFDDYYAIEDFTDRNSFTYQMALLEASDKKINLILKNFDKAISTKSNNLDIDLNYLNYTNEFSYRIHINEKEQISTKRYILLDPIPKDAELFKKYWLFYFLADCKKIVWNIRDILNRPQIEQEVSINIFELNTKAQKKERLLNEKSIEIFSTSKPREEQLKEYYQAILPKSIENTDNLLFWCEKMEENFGKELGYLDSEKEKLNQLVIKLKKNHLNKFEKAVTKIELVDKKKFLLEYENTIENLKLKKEIENSNLSKFTNTILSRVKFMLSKDDFRKVEQTKKKAPKKKIKYYSFTLKDYNENYEKLNDLRDSLKKKELIAQDTSLANFKKVFSGGEIEKPIVWTGNISELYYFISQLHNKLKYVEYLKQQQWVVANDCFIQEDGNQFGRYNFRGQQVPATSKSIDTALKTLSSL